MATTEVIHDHGAANNGNNVMGFMLGVILLVILAFLAFYYFGAGRLLGGYNTPQVNVPGKIDVNVNK